MQVSNKTVTSFHYELYSADDKIIETTRDGDPTLALIGSKSMIVGLEQSLLGKSPGDSYELTLEPREAYGTRTDDNVQRVPAKYLKHEGKLKVGQIVRLDSNQGIKTCTILKVGKFNVDVDMNHPLAGETIRYQIEITDVRQASDEEIAHGHAHGAGGHQH